MFSDQKTMGGNKFSKAYLEKLRIDLANAAREYQSVNHFKKEVEDSVQTNKELEDRVTELGIQDKKLEEVRNEEIKQNTALGEALQYYDLKNTEIFGNNPFMVDAVFLHQKHVQF
ncbi:hypothetical protein HDE_11186 [Halotydeus destructor]|nr:hypothetical protein HDE_11186 [Halotydeus destructor]